MAVSQRLSLALVFAVAAAGLLHFSPSYVDARATPMSHFSVASLTSTISAVPSPPPAYDSAAPFASPSDAPVPAPSFDDGAPVPAPSSDADAPVPAATTRSTGARGFGLYGRESSVTASELFKIESQLDEHDEEDDDDLVETKPVTPKPYGASTYATNTLGDTKAVSASYRGNDVSLESKPYVFGKTYSQEESDLDGHNNNKVQSYEEELDTQTPKSTEKAFRSGADVYYGHSTPVASTKAQAYTFGDDANLNTNEFGNKRQESSTQSTSNPSPYFAYGKPYLNANTNKYSGMSDTRKPENQQLYYSAAKGLASSRPYSVSNNERTSNYGYYSDAAGKVSGTSTKAYSNDQSRYSTNGQSLNEYETMEEYYKSQGIQP